MQAQMNSTLTAYSGIIKEMDTMSLAWVKKSVIENLISHYFFVTKLKGLFVCFRSQMGKRRPSFINVRRENGKE